MLTYSSRFGEMTENAVDSIHNYYERIVLETLVKVSERAATDQEYLCDAACIALNHLPPRYIRYDVDMNFFMTPKELDEVQQRVVAAVQDAIAYVDKKELENDDES